MTDAAPREPPAWVSKRDGRLVPFEADKISRSLFAATEALGRPDAFLARELADGVVHFLTLEGDTPPSTAQIAELVVKVVRELGQPALAAAFADHARRRPAKTGRQGDEGVSLSPPLLVSLSPRAADAPLAEVLAACTRAYALQAVFTRDLVAAQDAGLLTLTGLDAPDRLSDCVLAPPSRPGADLTAAVEEVARLAGRCVVLDAPEHLLAVSGRADTAGAADLVRRFLLGLRLTGLHAVVNLNSAAPPSWADDRAEGPLFDAQRSRTPPDVLLPLGEQMAAAFLAWDGFEIRPTSGPTAGRVRIDWHLGQRDFAPAARERLLRLARLALDGAPLGFVFDRPRRPVPLAEGADREHPAVLLTVGLHLPRLAEQPGVSGDGERFLKKLGSLVRLALSAAVQKREHLRRQDRARPADQADAPAVTSGFLLDRARLVVAPVGLDAVVRRLTGAGMGDGGASLELGKRIVERLREVLRQDGRSAHLDACVDGPFDFQVGARNTQQVQWPEAAGAAGVTPWDLAMSLKGQFRAGGELHAVADGGTLALFVPDDRPPTADQVAGWLRSLRHAEVVRVRLIRGAPVPRQLTFVA
jgi:hypothetical protein